MKHLLKVKDPGSALTHFIAMVLAAIAAAPLIIKAYNGSNNQYTASFVIFIASMICLYCASTVYHTFDISEKCNVILRKIDHSMIFVLIAGSYTPVCAVVLPHKLGYPLLITVWIIALLGIAFKLCWINCPHWLSSAMYIGMGWLSIVGFSSMVKNLSHSAFLIFFLGGIIYTAGGIIYAKKLPIFTKHNWKNFGNHELFHVFVMLGSFCHFMVIYHYLA